MRITMRVVLIRNDNENVIATNNVILYENYIDAANDNDIDNDNAIAIDTDKNENKATYNITDEY